MAIQQIDRGEHRILRRLALGLLWLLTAAAQAGPATITVDRATPRLALDGALQVIADRQARMQWRDVASGAHDGATLPATADIPNLGYVRHPYWVRIRLANRGGEPLERLLVLRRGSKHMQSAWIEREGRLVRELQIGGRYPVSGDRRSRHAVIALELPAYSTTDLTLRIESSTATSLAYELVDEDSFAGEQLAAAWLFGLLFGLLFTTGLYVLALYGAIRDRVYLWFAGFALSMGVYLMHFEGYAFIALWDGRQVLGSHVSLYAGALQLICTVLFVRLFVDTPRLFPRADRRLVLPLAVALLVVIPLFPLSNWLANHLAAFGAVLSVLVVTTLVLIAHLRGLLKLRSFLIAVLVFLASSVAFLLKQAGLLADGPLISLLQPMLSGLTALLFAVAIAHRFRLMTQQSQATIRRNEARLEQSVSDRTRALTVAKQRAETALTQLQSAQDELIRSEKMAALGGLVAGVAHEINTPLGIALTASSHLAEQSQQIAGQLAEGGLRRTDLERFVDEAEQAALLVKDNLGRAVHLVQSFKQVSVDRSLDDRRRFDLAEYLATVLESMEPAWKQRPLRVQTDCPAAIELDSYPGALGQVVTNLVQNALTHAFADDQPGLLSIDVRLIDDGAVELNFMDDGSGIEPAHLPHIFDPFYTTRRARGGTGLGMHITFNLVTHKLGGKIRLASSPGAGTRVTVQLPLTAP
jgi:signal transduction histidine kinase